MQWKTFGEETPPLNKKLLVWRLKNQKYIVVELKELNCIEEGNHIEWVTQWNVVHYCDINDAWMEFPTYSVMKEYK